MIGLLWVILWLLVGREHPDARRMRIHATQEKHPRSHWSVIRPILFSRTVLISTLAGITLPNVVGGIALIACGTFADRVFRLTRSHRRSYAYPVTALLIVSALCVYLAVSVPSALGSVIFFTLALIGVTFPILATIITAVAPAAHRGAVLGTYGAISTLPGLIAPLVTGLIIQAVGRNVASGFSHAYLLASLLLLIGGPGICLARQSKIE